MRRGEHKDLRRPELRLSRALLLSIREEWTLFSFRNNAHPSHVDIIMAEECRPAFGRRYLSDPDRVFEHNAWDNVTWGEEQETVALSKVKENSAEFVPEHVKDEFQRQAAEHWNGFYEQHQNRFFKDRHWLFTEFPELKGPPPGSGNKFSMLEVGCGAGNTVFPILQVNVNPNLFVYCCDFAESAVKLVQEHSLYDPQRCLAFQCDITSVSPLPIEDGTLDLVVLIFVLSAIEPDQYPFVIERLCKLLRPGGKMLFRDYGKFDMAQLRFKKGQCLADNFYVRGDGTRVYFFTEDEVDELLSGAGLKQEQLYVDRRLQINRGKQLKMYRVWIQAKYSKPNEEEDLNPSQPARKDQNLSHSESARE